MFAESCKFLLIFKPLKTSLHGIQTEREYSQFGQRIMFSGYKNIGPMQTLWRSQEGPKSRLYGVLYGNYKSHVKSKFFVGRSCMELLNI